MEITADEVLAPSGGIEAPERQRAVEWLRETLSAVDSLPSKEIFRIAKDQGFTDITLNRAQKELGVKCFPVFDDDGNKSWHWRLSSDENKEKTNIPGCV